MYWPNIDAALEQLCRSCPDCELDRPTQPREPQIHLPVPDRAYRYQSADFADIGGLKFLVIADWYSGMFSTYEMSRVDASAIIYMQCRKFEGNLAEASASRSCGGGPGGLLFICLFVYLFIFKFSRRICLGCLNAIYGPVHALRKSFTDTAVPEILYTDNGPPFPSYEVQDFLRRWGVRWVSSSPYYARSNSYAENGVKQAKGLLRKCIWNRRIDQEKWCKGLLSLRNTPHKTTGLSPAVLVYGHPVNEVVPAHKSALQKSWHKLAEYDTMIARE